MYGLKELNFTLPSNTISIDTIAKEIDLDKEILQNIKNGGLKTIPFCSDIYSLIEKSFLKIDLTDIKGVIYASSVDFEIKHDLDIEFCKIGGEPCAVLHLALKLAQNWAKKVNGDILVMGVDKPLSLNKRVYFNSVNGDIVITAIVSNKNVQHQIISSYTDSYIFADNGEKSKQNDIIKFRENNPLLIRENIYTNLKKANLDLNDIKYIFPHTPYIQIWDIIAKILNFPRERIWTNYIEETGHLNSNDSFYHYLKAIEQRIVKKDDIVLLLNNGFGGSRGSTILKYKGKIK
jgi:3-oxoacyl-[acyl-carrier-protein] synthase-3